MSLDDLASARERFLGSLKGELTVLPGADAFLAYWRNVEEEAQQTEDLSRLDGWVRNLARDKERLQALKQRKSEAASSQVGAEAGVRMIAQLLALLDDIERRLRHRFHTMRGRLGAWVWLGGLGTKRKPLPDAAEGKEEEKKKDQAAVLAKKKEPVKPTKSKGA